MMSDEAASRQNLDNAVTTIPNSPVKKLHLNKDFGFIGSNVPDSYIDVNVIDQSNDEYNESPILIPRRDD